MLMQSIAVDYGPKGVRANAVCPGWVRTDMADAAMDEVAEMRGTDREGAYRRVHAAMPIPRPAETSEVAGTGLLAALARGGVRQRCRDPGGRRRERPRPRPDRVRGGTP